ncbi:MAG TPA: PLP-dependent aminotransferase family protein [Hymenobacter sp.]|jgi:DNA-binding transcriptional MocR family regulator
MSRSPDLLYRRIAAALAHQIQTGGLRVGDQLPSLRALQRLHGVSLNTAKQAYWELERQWLIEARPQSGFYVSRTPGQALALPPTSAPPAAEGTESAEALIIRVYETLDNPAFTQLSMAVPDASLLPVAKLNKAVGRALRTLPGSGTGYEELAGSARLRGAVARWSFTWGGTLQAEELITTAGAMNALTYSLLAVTKPGDTVAVESPTYVWALQLIRSLGLRALELPTHPVTGIELEALQQALPRIQACLLIPNFSNPLGNCMPDDHKRAVVQLLASRQIPLIEDDVYGDLYYGTRRPPPCKAFDEQGLVLWCSSVSKTVAPGYRVGWVAAGQFQEAIRQRKLLQAISSPPLNQEVIADFLEQGRYEHHLHTLRGVLHANSRACRRAIAEYFPAETRVTQPTGGFTLWVELPRQVDTRVLFEAMLRRRISIAPGRLFTQHNQFNHCLRLSYGVPWTPHVEACLQELGGLAQQLAISAG